MEGAKSTYVTQEQHDEFAKLIEVKNIVLEKENDRQNERLRILEADIRQISELVASVKELAISMENMMKVQEQQGRDISDLKNRDGEMWQTVVKYAISALVGGVIAFVLTQFGM